MKAKTADFILTKILGWTGEDNFPKDPKSLMLGVPHTSVWDLVISYLYAISKGAPIHILVKEKFFIWPVGALLRKWGAIPLKSKSKGGTSTLMQMIEAFNTHDHIFMGLAPEGTRKPVKKWKTGCFVISKRANIPIYAGFIDWGRKVVSCGEKFELTDDPQADMLRLQQHYKALGVQAKFPKKFVYDDGVE